MLAKHDFRVVSDVLRFLRLVCVCVCVCAFFCLRRSTWGRSGHVLKHALAAKAPVPEG